MFGNGLWLWAIQLSAASALHLFGIGGTPVLCVPASDLDPALIAYADESVHLSPGGGHTPGFSFLIPRAALESEIKGLAFLPTLGHDPYVNALSGTVSLIGKEDFRLGPSLRARSTEDEWYSKGDCNRPTVRRLGVPRLFEIKCSRNADYASLWSTAPHANSRMPNPNDLVVATCRSEIINRPHRQTERRNTCNRIFRNGSLLIDYAFLEANASAYPHFDGLITKKISQWKANCKRQHASN